MPNSEQSQEDYDRVRWAQEQIETSDEQTAILTDLGITKHLIDYNQRHHNQPNNTVPTPLIDPDTLKLGLVINGMPEIRGWWDPVEPESASILFNQTVNQRIEWRWTLSGSSKTGYFIGIPEPESQLTIVQSQELENMFKVIPDAEVRT